MKTLATCLAVASLLISAPAMSAETEEGFVPIFDGKTLEGWKISGNKDAFKVEDGAIVANGDCAHAFYAGEVNGGKFEEFELRADVMTKPNSNGGIYIHTSWQDSGWPGKGYEIQVNNTQHDPKKSGGLYSVVDNMKPFEDNVWMKYVIRVKDGKITSIVNGKELVDDYQPEAGQSKLQEGGGTFALQAHDTGSTVLYKNLRVKVLK